MNTGSILSKCLDDNETCKKMFEFLSKTYLHVDIIREVENITPDVPHIKTTIATDAKKEALNHLNYIKAKNELPEEIYQHHANIITNLDQTVINSLEGELIIASVNAKICFYLSSVIIDELELIDIYFYLHMTRPKLLEWLIKKQNPSDHFKKYIKKKGYII